jgi:hypothetical protein
MDTLIRWARSATGIRKKTREEVCGENALPPQVRECVAVHDRGMASPFIAVAPITDPSNPAFREAGHVDGSAEMCVAALDLDAGTCIGCYPGSGKQWSEDGRPAGAFADGYCIELRDKRGFLIPNPEDPNPLFRSNDFRTNVDVPTGPQGRAANMRYLEIWQAGLPYAIFFTSAIVQKGEELLWDYGSGYWSDDELTRFRLSSLDEQASGWEQFQEDFATSTAVRRVQSLLSSEVAKVLVGGAVWAWLMATEQETLAAVWICIGALAYGVMLVRKRANPLNL